MTCWNCGAAAEALLCPDCDALQPPDPEASHFAVLGLKIAFAQEADEVTAAHRARQRKVHPDRFASKTPRERRFSLEHATALNDAVRILKDPQRRAEYLLQLRGVKVGAEGEDRVQLDPMFLMEIMEIREAIEELDFKDAHTERGQIHNEVVTRFEGTVQALGEALDASEETPPRLIQQAAQLRYLRRIIEELEAQEP